MNISNPAKDHGLACDMLRDAFSHRGAWLFLLLDEAAKRGHDVEAFARPAIRRMGHVHGAERFSDEAREDLLIFAQEFATDIPRQIFDMEVVESTASRFVVDFHHCPLLTGWLKLSNDQDAIKKACDIAMDGDRGIADTLENYTFTLEKTLAEGESACRLVFEKK